MINLTNNTLFLFLTRAMYFSRLKRERERKKITSLKLHRAFSGYTRRTTVKGAARRIEHRPEMWYSTTGRCRMHCPKSVGASHMLARASFSSFVLFNLYKYQIAPDPHNINKKKHTILHQKEVKIENAPTFIVKKIQILRVF